MRLRPAPPSARCPQPSPTCSVATAPPLGAAGTLVESDIVGGAAHLWDCIPSKALVASALRLDSLRGASRLGIEGVGMPAVDMNRLSTRADAICDRLPPR